ncbi:unnamed protein product [Rotaria sp. Silwood1]|nr:unnamed protein product [Rotaria sp. Silwood1]
MAASDNVNHRLLASVRDEPKQMLQPISGYEEEPLLPLEEACKPLKNILDQELEQNIIIAKMNSEKPENGLTQDEAASIHLYTMEWKNGENSLYAVLNRTLRIADRSKLQPWFRYLKLFLTAFFKLPGIPENLSAVYPKGKKFAWWGVSSCTSAISVLETPLYLGTSGERTMFSIQTASGKCIKAHSYFQQEDEILLAPGRYFEVIDKLSSADGLHIIHIREVSPPYQMLADPFDLRQLKNALSQPNQVSDSEKNQKNDETPSSILKPPLPSTVTESSKPSATLQSSTSIASKTARPSISGAAQYVDVS